MNSAAQFKDDVEKMLAEHPAPWRIEKTQIGDKQIVDCQHFNVTIFDAEDESLFSGLVAAVNFYHWMHQPISGPEITAESMVGASIAAEQRL